MFRLTCTTLWKLLEYFKQSYLLLLLLLFFFRIFPLTKGIRTNFSGSQFRRRQQISFRPRNRKLLGPPSLPCFSLSDLPTRAFTTHRERERDRDVFSSSISPRPTLPRFRILRLVLYQRAIMSISRCPINVTYKCKQHRQHFLL